MRFERLTSESEIRNLIQWHNVHSDFLVIDVETTSPHPRRAELLDIQISGTEENHAVIFNADYRELLVELAPNIALVAHNSKYDLHVLFRHGVDLLDRPFRDTLLMGHLLDENRESYSLDSFVKERADDHYKSDFWEKYERYEDASEADKVRYGCSDIYWTGRLYREFKSRIIEDGVPDRLVDHVHRLQASLLRTEIEGIRVDLDYLQELGVKLKRRIDELGPEMRGLVKDEIEILELESWQKALSERKTEAGRARVVRPSFSFESSKQLSTLLYHRLGLTTQRNEKTRAITTDYAALERLRETHPVIPLIQENRELQKVYTAYVEGTLDRVDQSRIYPQFRVAGTVTGRLSHSNPNLAQLPKSGGIRAIYIPNPGRRFISADYSQLEVIIETNLTSDPTLVRMLENGESKHDVTARELGCSRDLAKTLNFAMQYWCGPGKVAKLLGVSDDEGRRVYNRYWEVYSGSKRLKAKTDKMVEDGEPIVSLFGRKRRFRPGKRTTWDKDLRQAYNFLIQGTGADITHEAFYKIDAWLRGRGVGRAILEVHDEELIEVEEKYGEEAQEALIRIMVGVGARLGLKVPLKAEGSGLMSRWED